MTTDAASALPGTTTGVRHAPVPPTAAGMPRPREASVDDLVQNGVRTFLARLSRSTSSSLQTILDDVVTASTALLADCGAVWLLSPDGSTLDPVAFHDLDPTRKQALGTTLGGIRPALNGGLLSQVVRTGEAVIVDSVDTSSRAGAFAPYRAFVERFGVSSMIIVPLTSRGATFGALGLVRVKDRPPFGQGGLARALELATHAASFLDTARLLDQLRRQATLLDNVFDAVVALDPEWRITSWNAGAARTYALPAELAVGRRVGEVIPTDLDPVRGAFVPDDDALAAEARAVLLREGRWSGRVVQQRPDGTLLHVESSVTLARDLDGTLLGAVAVNRDLTAEIEAEAALRAQERTAQTVLDALPNLTAVVDAEGMIIAVNQAWRNQAVQHGAEPAGVGIGADYLGVLRRAADAEPAARESLEGNEGVLSGALPTFELDYDVAVPGVERSYVLTAVPLPGTGAVISHHDITWRKSLERQLSYRATHDTLTGLPNRLLLNDRLVQALSRAARSRLKVGVLFCDLDQFKVLNDTLGHAVGDQVLVAVARRLEHACRASDSVTRFGGDEFVVVVEDVEDVAVIEQIAQRLLDSLTSPIRVDDSDLWFGVSIGIVVSEGELRATPDHVDALLRDADTAMYRAKEGGRNRIVVFDPSMREEVAKRMALTMSLRHAVDRDEFRVVYQPQFSCDGEQLVGVEALLRWQHPHKGLILPGEFIAAAEESGAIVEIGRWIIDAACRQSAEWERESGSPLSVSVNLSPRQLMSRSLLGTVRDAMHHHGIGPDRLCLEITEGALMQDPELATETLHALRDLGVRIAVDDFGTGYSSLAYLQRFPVDTLKVDRSFVARLADTPKTAALVRGIVQLGHALGLTTVAEGVETEEQLAAVAVAGCDAFQGFLRARPLPAAAITALLPPP